MIAGLPNWVKNPLRRFKNTVESIVYGGTDRYCPVCDKYFSRFRSSGNVVRHDAQCLNCGALERHRLLWLYLSQKTNLFDGEPKTVLHVAPEPCLEAKLKKHLKGGYLTADLYNPSAMVKMDITEIEYPNESFDVIYCSHVLEHVPDDKKALRELFRVLKTSGWAILLVPITVDVTYEDPTIVTPEGRLEAFGQDDHVRRYGRDYADRLRDAGFTVEVVEVTDLATPEEAVRMGLTPASGEIYHCFK